MWLRGRGPSRSTSAVFDVLLQLDAERAVIPDRTQAAIDLRGLREKSAAFAEADRMRAVSAIERLRQGTRSEGRAGNWKEKRLRGPPGARFGVRCRKLHRKEPSSRSKHTYLSRSPASHRVTISQPRRDNCSFTTPTGGHRPPDALDTHMTRPQDADERWTESQPSVDLPCSMLLSSPSSASWRSLPCPESTCTGSGNAGVHILSTTMVSVNAKR